MVSLMPYPFQPNINLKYAPTLWAGLHDDNPVRIFVGPVGSGKTTFCAAEVFSRALQQEPSPDGIRRFKAGIVRNTMPELRRTTIPTWLAIFPEIACGPIRYSTPAEHHIQIRPKDFKWIDKEAGKYEGSPGLDLIVEFFALDRPEDVKALLSWEGTMIWFNEVREIHKAIIDMADLRVGRYPSIAKGGVLPTWFGIIGDTNPPDEEHWIYQADQGVDQYGEHIGRPMGWSMYFQPPAVVEVIQVEKGHWQSIHGEPLKIDVYNEDHIHRAAASIWAVNPNAENLPNLIVHKALDPTGDLLGRGGYYARGLQGKNRDWIRAYFQGRYQFVREGKAVIPEFDPLTMVRDDTPVLEHAEIVVGSDIGGNTLNPAAVLMQRGPRGIWIAHDEVVASDMGLDRFEGELNAAFVSRFPGRKCDSLWGDPAGRTRDGIFETVAFDHLLQKGWPALPAPSNDIRIRVDAIKAPMGRLIDGLPGVIINRRCAKLIKGLSGAWFYRRMATKGPAKYAEKPDKSHPYSDVCDGFGYGLSGGGETRQAARPRADDPMMVDGGPSYVGKVQVDRVQPGEQYQANTNFNVFDD
jgi:hypothetical protein